MSKLAATITIPVIPVGVSLTVAASATAGTGRAAGDRDCEATCNDHAIVAPVSCAGHLQRTMKRWQGACVGIVLHDMARHGRKGVYLADKDEQQEKDNEHLRARKAIKSWR